MVARSNDTSESAVRACRANAFQHAAWDQVGDVPAGAEERAHLRRGDFRKLRPVGAGFWKSRPLHGDDAGELLDAGKVLPLRALGVQIGAEDQRPAGARVLLHQVLEEIDRARLTRFLLGARDARARPALRQVAAQPGAAGVAALA